MQSKYLITEDRAREEGKRACIAGKKKSFCPYSGTKAEAVLRVAWVEGHAEQAKVEAGEAKEALGK